MIPCFIRHPESETWINMVGGLQPFCLGEGNNVHAEK